MIILFTDSSADYFCLLFVEGEKMLINVGFVWQRQAGEFTLRNTTK